MENVSTKEHLLVLIISLQSKEISNFLRTRCETEMLGTDLRADISRIMGETPDREIVSKYADWRQSEAGQSQKFRHFLREEFGMSRRELRNTKCMAILKLIGFDE